MYVPRAPRVRGYSRLYLEDMATLKDYGGQNYKLTLHRRLRQAGVEDNRKYRPKKGTVHDKKMDCNISRARSKIFEYAACNEWDYFCNLTLDQRKYDRHNLAVYIRELTQWLRNYGKKNKSAIKYLFIPEHHKDGAWHIHGLIKGVPESDTEDFIPSKHPQKLIDAGYKNWPPYGSKFGFVSLGEVKNPEAVSKYLTKYITKDMEANNRQLGARLYYCSKGLKEAMEIKRGSMAATIKPDYENEHVKVQWFKDKGTALALFS